MGEGDRLCCKVGDLFILATVEKSIGSNPMFFYDFVSDNTSNSALGEGNSAMRMNTQCNFMSSRA